MALQPADHGASSTAHIGFEVGQIYDRRTDIHAPFGGSHRSGISPSKQSDAVFLFTGDSGEQFGYQDRTDDFGVFHYTGEGQAGHMTLTGGNRAIYEHAQNGRSLYLFKALGKKSGRSLGQRYIGEFSCAEHYWREGLDRQGNLRKVVVFKLVPVRSIDEAGVEPSAEEPIPTSLEEARQLAIKALQGSESSEPGSAVRNIYKRSARVKNYVLMRAAGVCESCGITAPFKRKNGSPYLEPHHINRLSDGGLDHPRFIGAICPSCHREIHYGDDGEEKNNRLRQHVERLES